LALAVTENEAFQRAVTALRSGHIEDAQRLFKQVLRKQPKHVAALNLLGIVLTQLGRFAEAETYLRRALQENANSDATLYNYGIVLKALHRPAEALQRFTEALQINPAAAETWNNRGTVFNDLKRHDEAIADFDKAIALQPRYAEAYCNKGKTLAILGRFEDALAAFTVANTLNPDLAEAWLGRAQAIHTLQPDDAAIASYTKALALKADLIEAWIGRGNKFAELKRHDDALADYARAITLAPDLAAAWLGRGNVLFALTRNDEALQAYDRALSLDPDLPQAWLGRGNVLAELQRYDEASLAYDKATALKPDLAEAWFGLGNRSLEAKRYDDALGAYDRAIALRSDFVEAWYGRANVLLEMNLTEDAEAALRRARTIDPDFPELRFAECFSLLRILYSSADDIALQRERYGTKLRGLADYVRENGAQRDLIKAVRSKSPFYLAYQGLNDRELQRLYGSILCSIAERAFPPAPMPPPPLPGEPVRVGIVSGFFHMHSNWKVPIKGWLGQLDRKRFRLFGYHLGTKSDAETKVAAAMCDRFVHRALSIEGWRREIHADAPHVLIYPGLLMDDTSTLLAAQRLAPVQCNSWGHPETSGIPTLDYFLSSELMEPADAAEHYTERLIRLPNLSVYYEPIEPEPCLMNRAALGLRADAPVFWCGQSLYKFLPQFDFVFAEIARHANNCQFAFLQYQGTQQITEMFRQRLDRAFALSGLRTSDHIVFLPRLSQSEYSAAIGLCDVFLDSIGWSGCNSTLESLPHNIPIVTMPGPLMRGRHSAAILRMMGMTETIAADCDEYIAIAARLAKDSDQRQALRRTISSNKHRLFRDRECIEALQQFLDRTARQQPNGQ